MTGERALVLIPCSGTKYESPTRIMPKGPIKGIAPLRERMVHLVGNITSGPAVSAAALYQGALYGQCRGSLAALANGEFPRIDLLIVSAYYGLVHPAEPIAKYNLRMGDEVAGNKVYRWWQKFQLGAALEAYVEARDITQVWSLLGSSPPRSQYQQSLDPFWQRMKGKIPCRQVIVPGGGQSNSSRRGAWLGAVVTRDPMHLVAANPSVDAFSRASGNLRTNADPSRTDHAERGKAWLSPFSSCRAANIEARIRKVQPLAMMT